jgi:hypothetical protein
MILVIAALMVAVFAAHVIFAIARADRARGPLVKDHG